MRELRELTGRDLADPAACVAACRELVEGNQAALVALTLGSQGAILGAPGGVWRAWPLPIQAVSTVGAGDSFLAAMVCRLSEKATAEDSFRVGVAAGSAALLHAGTQLCHPQRLAELLPQLHLDRVV